MNSIRLRKRLLEGTRSIKILKFASEVGQLAIFRAQLEIYASVLGRSSGVPAEHALTRHEDRELERAIHLEGSTRGQALVLKLGQTVFE